MSTTRVIKLSELGVISPGDSCLIYLPDGRVVEVCHDVDSVDFYYKNPECNDSKGILGTLICTLGAK